MEVAILFLLILLAWTMKRVAGIENRLDAMEQKAGLIPGQANPFVLQDGTVREVNMPFPLSHYRNQRPTPEELSRRATNEYVKKVREEAKEAEQ